MERALRLGTNKIKELQIATKLQIATLPKIRFPFPLGKRLGVRSPAPLSPQRFGLSDDGTRITWRA